MAVLNSTILERAWLSGSNDYQQRIPYPTQNDYAQHVQELFAPYNADLFNQFSMLLNGLAETYVVQKRFENPLAALKKSSLLFGNSVRGVAVKYLQAHSYKIDDETLLKLEKPQFREWFYSVAEPRRYEFSWSRYELARVFSQDGYGFDELLTATMNQMFSSDNYDEMNLMIQCFAEADARFTLYRENISAAPTTEAAAKELLAKLRMYADRLKFPTMLYNGIDIPVHENPETLILWVTPEFAYVDVEALAGVFNLDKADVKYRKIVIPEFPIPNVYAALTSEDFIYCRDVHYGVEPPFYNPANMTYKYYLHHAQIIGVNPVANCILFTTDAGTSVKTITMATTGMNVGANAEYYYPYAGGAALIDIELEGTVTASDSSEVSMIQVKPNSATFEVVAARVIPGENDDPDTIEPIPLNSRTFVDARGVLHIQRSGLEVGDIITVTAKTTYVNPSTGVAAEYSGTVDVEIQDGSGFEYAQLTYVDEYPYLVYENAEFPSLA